MISLSDFVRRSLSQIKIIKHTDNNRREYRIFHGLSVPTENWQGDKFAYLNYLSWCVATELYEEALEIVNECTSRWMNVLDIQINENTGICLFDIYPSRNDFTSHKFIIYQMGDCFGIAFSDRDVPFEAELLSDDQTIQYCEINEKFGIITYLRQFKVLFDLYTDSTEVLLNFFQPWSGIKIRNINHKNEHLNREWGPSSFLKTFNEMQKRVIYDAFMLETGILGVQGPPGTGKTHTITGIVWELLFNFPERRILICAQSNYAATNCFDKINCLNWKQFVDCRGSKHNFEYISPFRAGSETRNSNQIKTDADQHWEFRKQRFNLKANIRKKHYLQNMKIIVTTTSSSARSELGSLAFDYLIIDEAAQINEVETLLAIYHAKAKRIYLVGDQLQLGPLVRSEMAKRQNFDRSMFERLYNDNLIKTYLLTKQYRMHPEICRYISKAFYRGHLEIGENVKNMPNSLFEIDEFEHFMFIDVDGTSDINTDLMSYFNYGEAAKVIEMTNRILSTGRVDLKDIVVITPYSGQKDLIVGLVKSTKNEKLRVETVDSMQGKESRIVLLSTVKSDSERLGFIKENQKRQNVALSRAKEYLFIFGNLKAFENEDIWRKMFNYLSREGNISFKEIKFK
eukprot:NODE_696_length_4665_cov_0.259965.p2 type:complete len:627 gc:universal NODE_696_length_4665_cov_0.259965:2556-4436(+)